MATAQDRREKRASIPTPLATGRVVRGGDETTRQLIDIVDLPDLREGVPFDGVLLERIQNDIAAVLIVERHEVATVGIGNHGAVAALQRTPQ
jgi:hypothetical protein